MGLYFEERDMATMRDMFYECIVSTKFVDLEHVPVMYDILISRTKNVQFTLSLKKNVHGGLNVDDAVFAYSWFEHGVRSLEHGVLSDSNTKDRILHCLCNSQLPDSTLIYRILTSILRPWQNTEATFFSVFIPLISWWGPVIQQRIPAERLVYEYMRSADHRTRVKPQSSTMADIYQDKLGWLLYFNRIATQLNKNLLDVEDAVPYILERLAVMANMAMLSILIRNPVIPELKEKRGFYSNQMKKLLSNVKVPLGSPPVMLNSRR